MPLPAVAKTWQFSHLSNSLSGVQQTDLDAIFISIKNALIGFGLSPWTVIGSSNGVAAGLDGVDRVTSTIVHANAGSAHSWIVLKQGGSNAQVMFSFLAATASMLIRWSPAAGFTGGSITADPTATDSPTALINGFWCGNIGGTGGQYRTHVQHSTDGQCTRVFICANGLAAGCWVIDKPGNPSTGWAAPVVASFSSIGNNITDTSLLAVSSWLGQAKFQAFGPASGGTTMPLTITYEEIGSGNSWVGDAFGNPNEISGEYLFGAVGLFHNTTTGQRGRHGDILDLYFTHQGSVMGDTFPASGTKQFQQVGNMVVPSDGTGWLFS